MLSDATMRYGEDLCTALLGLDALYVSDPHGERQGDGAPADLERLVVLNMAPNHQPDAFADYAAAISRFEELRRRAAELPEVDRQLYYEQCCASAIAFADWRAAGLPFEQQLAGFLHVPTLPVDETTLDDLRGQMHAILTDLGYGGDLAAQMAAWQERQRVPPGDVGQVLTDLLSEAWDLTAERMTIPAPKSDGLRVETTSGVPYNAMCDYRHRLVRVNTDPILTLPALRHLAVHEGYPGHYVQFKRREVGYAEGRTPADALLSVVNTASSSPFEGIADVGMDVIGWQTAPDDRLAGMLARYRSGLGTRAAWRLHVAGWSPARVRESLFQDALVGGEGWVDARLRFISAADRAVLIWSYWWGERSVGPVWASVRDTPERWPAYFSFVYDRMHSPRSIALFT